MVGLANFFCAYNIAASNISDVYETQLTGKQICACCDPNDQVIFSSQATKCHITNTYQILPQMRVYQSTRLTSQWTLNCPNLPDLNFRPKIPQVFSNFVLIRWSQIVDHGSIFHHCLKFYHHSKQMVPECRHPMDHHVVLKIYKMCKTLVRLQYAYLILYVA